MKIKKADTKQTFDNRFGRNYVWQAQISRLYVSSYISGVMLTSDSDSMPLQSEYFDSLVAMVNNETIAISRKKPYYDSNKYCMMWTAAHADVFTKTFSSDCSFEEFCDQYQKNYPPSIISDELFLTNAIDASGFKLSFMDHLPVVRIDKINWGYKVERLQRGEFTDSHVLRPFKKYSRELTKLMSDRFPSDSTITEFAKKYSKPEWNANWSPKSPDELKAIHKDIELIDPYSYNCGTHVWPCSDVISFLGSSCKNVIEFGGGFWSTSLFLGTGASVLTIEQGQNVPAEVNSKWVKYLKGIYKETPNWCFISSPGEEGWKDFSFHDADIVFVDGAAGARWQIVNQSIADGYPIVIAHDTEHNGFRWSNIDTKDYSRIDYSGFRHNGSTIWTKNVELISTLLLKPGYVLVPQDKIKQYNPSR